MEKPIILGTQLTDEPISEEKRNQIRKPNRNYILESLTGSDILRGNDSSDRQIYGNNKKFQQGWTEKNHLSVDKCSCNIEDKTIEKFSYDQLFLEAAQNWELEKLYTELSDAKHLGSFRYKKLSSVEKAILRGLLCGFAPKEIAQKLNWTTGSLTVHLSKGIYRYVETITQHDANTIRNWRDVASWLEKAAYKVPKAKQNWQGAPRISSFYGRKKELSQLETWIVTEKYQLVTLYGMAGIGKTSLGVKLAEKIQDKFDFIIWQNIHYQPDLSQILTELLNFFSDTHLKIPLSLDKKITLLMSYLTNSKCLIIFDGLEEIFRDNYYAGKIKDKYSDYINFWNTIITIHHQSCLVMIGQEEPDQMIFWQDYNVGSLEVTGLGESGKKILSEKFFATTKCWKMLIQRYGGNPLALKLVGGIIQEIFHGNISEFLNTETESDVIIPMFFSEVLKQQFQRLSALELQIIYAIAEINQLNNLEDLQKEIQPQVHLSNLALTLLSLKKRSLIQTVTITDKSFFTVSPVIRKFILREYLF